MWEPLEGADDYPGPCGKADFSRGRYNAQGNLAGVTMDISEAVRDAAAVLVVVPVFAHEPIFQKLIPHPRWPAHRRNAGNFAAYRLKRLMNEVGFRKSVTISTTETMPFACRIKTSIDRIHFKGKWQSTLRVAPLPPEQIFKEC